jgi:D-amino peptidase
MKILISVDMEGTTGVTCPDDVRPNTPGWSHFRNLMTDEANAAIEGFLEGGATEFLVNDSHSSMRNLQIDRLHPKGKLLSGKHKRYSMMEGIDSDVNAVAFIGYHTGAGKQGILSHTYLGTTYTGVWLNEIECSEGYMNSLLAAHFGVPVILVTGDDLTVADTKTYAPEVIGVAVKTCVDRYSAICLPPEVTMNAIRGAAKEAISKITKVKPPTGPFTYRIQFDSTQPVIAATALPFVEQTGDREVSFTLPSILESHRAFGAVSSLVKSGIEEVYG